MPLSDCSPFKCAWIAVLTLLLPFVQAVSQSQIRVTKEARGAFSQLDQKSPFFTCFVQKGKPGRLGTLDRGPLKVGRFWSAFSESATTRQIAKLEATIRKLTKQGRRSRRALKVASAQLAAAKQALQKVAPFREQCPGTSASPAPPQGSPTPGPWPDPTLPPGGEFVGASNSLSPYREALTSAEINHLLDKVAFGGSPQLRDVGMNRGLSELVDALVDGIGTSDELSRLNAATDDWTARGFYFNEDDSELRGIRIWTAEAAQIGQTYRTVFTPDPLREWMTLQMSAHFAVNLDRIGFSYSTFSGHGIPLHWELLRREALGSFRNLAQGMLTDPAMNFWLNNKDNRVGEPNQNFARELLELFTLGAVDPISAKANYGEDSVSAATSFLSGYYESMGKDRDTGRDAVGITYDAALHDSQGAPIFTEIPGAARVQSFTPQAIVDHILSNHPGAPRYLAERFAGQMLYPGLPENIVALLAAKLKSDNYEWKPFLRLVLKSQAMFSRSAERICITSPLESAFKLARRFPPPLVATGEQSRISYYSLYSIFSGAQDAGQGLFRPPSVFGWKGACNINRAGVVARGEGWLTAQKQLNVGRGCIGYMNYLNELKFDFTEALGLLQGDSAEVVASKVYGSLFDAPISPEARVKLASFLTTERNDEGTDRVVSVDLSDEYYVRRKIPRLLCIASGLFESGRR